MVFSLESLGSSVKIAKIVLLYVCILWIQTNLIYVLIALKICNRSKKEKFPHVRQNSSLSLPNICFKSFPEGPAQYTEFLDQSQKS